MPKPRKAFEVSLKVSDEVGQLAVQKITVSVNNTPPVVDIAGAKDGDFYTISGRELYFSCGFGSR